MPHTRLVAKLKATSAVTDLVSTRIYPVIATDDTLPCIVYEITSDEPMNASTGTPGTKNVQIELMCLSDTYPNARTLAAAVETALSGWEDSAGSIWHLTGSNDEPGDVAPGGNALEWHAVRQTYSVWYAA